MKQYLLIIGIISSVAIIKRSLAPGKRRPELYAISTPEPLGKASNARQSHQPIYAIVAIAKIVIKAVNA